MAFLQPLFLALAPLVLAPLVFFLMGPRVTREVSFSWVALLVGDLQEGRRGHTLRDWFLVLLRMLILASLILAMARPVWFGGGRPSRIVVDASWSMQPHWKALQERLAGLVGVIPVEALTEGRFQPLPEHPYGTVKMYPPSGVLWITDGQQGEGPSPRVLLPRPCNRGVRLLSWPHVALPGQPFEVDVLAYSTCEDTLSLHLPEGRLRRPLREHRDTLRISVEDCLRVAVEMGDPYPDDNALEVCPPRRAPVRVAVLAASPDTLLVARLLRVFPELFLRSDREKAEAWVVVGPLNLDYDERVRRRGVWFAPPEGLDPGPGWMVFPFLPDEEGGLRFLESPELLRRFYDALLGGPGLWVLEEGDTLRVGRGAEIAPRPGLLRLSGDTLEAVFTRSGTFRVITREETLRVVVQPPAEEVLVMPSRTREGHLPVPLARPLLLVAIGLLLVEALVVRGRL